MDVIALLLINLKFKINQKTTLIKNSITTPKYFLIISLNLKMHKIFHEENANA